MSTRRNCNNILPIYYIVKKGTVRGTVPHDTETTLQIISGFTQPPARQKPCTSIAFLNTHCPDTFFSINMKAYLFLPITRNNIKNKFIKSRYSDKAPMIASFLSSSVPSFPITL